MITRITIQLPKVLTYSKEKELGRLTIDKACEDILEYTQLLLSYSEISKKLRTYQGSDVKSLIQPYFPDRPVNVHNYTKKKRTYSIYHLIVTEED